jgi:hypothetical protein
MPTYSGFSRILATAQLGVSLLQRLTTTLQIKFVHLRCFLTSTEEHETVTYVLSHSHSCMYAKTNLNCMFFLSRKAIPGCIYPSKVSRHNNTLTIAQDTGPVQSQPFRLQSTQTLPTEVSSQTSKGTNIPLACCWRVSGVAAAWRESDFNEKS